MIVNEFGGEVYVKSQFGKGTVFGLTFKLEERNDDLQVDLRDKNPTAFWSGDKISYKLKKNPWHG